MSRLSRPLHIAYGGLLTWLANYAMQSAHNNAPWACAVDEKSGRAAKAAAASAGNEIRIRVL